MRSIDRLPERVLVGFLGEGTTGKLFGSISIIKPLNDVTHAMNGAVGCSLELDQWDLVPWLGHCNGCLGNDTQLCVAVDVEDHVAGLVSGGCFRVGGAVIKDLDDGVHGFGG
jgi:hypothetical protein